MELSGIGQSAGFLVLQTFTDTMLHAPAFKSPPAQGDVISKMTGNRHALTTKRIAEEPEIEQMACVRVKGDYAPHVQRALGLVDS